MKPIFSNRGFEHILGWASSLDGILRCATTAKEVHDLAQQHREFVDRLAEIAEQLQPKSVPQAATQE
jgi:hypothetical protein